MKQKLEAMGWVMYYECTLRCGHKQWYNHKDFKGYVVIVKGNNFSIEKDNNRIAGPLHQYQLEDTLKKFIQ